MRNSEKIINFTKDELESFIQDENSCVTINNSSYSLALYPYHLSNVSESIKRLLNAKVAKYDQRLDGIILGYKNLKLLTPYAALRADSCYIHVDIQGDFYIFKPKVGKKLTGVVNKTSHNHIGCLVHKVFNVAVPNKNKDEDEGWPGFNVEIGNTIEVSVTEMQLDGRLPYIRASIVNKTKFENNSVALETENEEIDTPKKQKKRKKDLNQTSDVVDNKIELLLESIKKQKKRHSTQTENPVDEAPNLNDSTKTQKKKRHSKSTENNVEETPNLNDSTKKQKKKRNSEPTENIETTAENINESPKKQKKRHSKQSENINVEPEKKKNRHSDIFDNLDNIKVEELSQKTLILNESLKKQKKQRQSQDEPNNLETNKITPKKQDTKIPSNSQRTNESDYFATPKIKRKQKPTETEVSDTILEKDSLEDFVPKEKKSKTDSSKKKKNKQNDEIKTNSEVSKTDSSKKKKNKQNDAVDANVELTEQLQTLKEQKKEKKRKSKELKLEQKLMNLSPVKPMADLEDRKIKKRLQSLSQTVDWENKELNLYDSDLEKTLNTPSDNKYLLEKTLEFNLAKIQALNANTPRKRKRKHDTDEDFIHNKKKSRLEED